MKSAVSVKVQSIDKNYGYTYVEVQAPNTLAMSFTVEYDSVEGVYRFQQPGENNKWQARPDERK